jgi:hypothetical protein
MLSDYTIVMVLKIAKSIIGGESVCDITVYDDTEVWGNNTHHIGPIPNAQGVYWSGMYNEFFYVMNVIGSGYPLTSGLSAFWLGPYGSLGTSYWSQTYSDGMISSEINASNSAFRWVGKRIEFCLAVTFTKSPMI